MSDDYDWGVSPEVFRKGLAVSVEVSLTAPPALEQDDREEQ